jgi:hypothetical protein
MLEGVRQARGEGCILRADVAAPRRLDSPLPRRDIDRQRCLCRRRSSGVARSLVEAAATSHERAFGPSGPQLGSGLTGDGGVIRPTVKSVGQDPVRSQRRPLIAFVSRPAQATSSTSFEVHGERFCTSAADAGFSGSSEDGRLGSSLWRLLKGGLFAIA